MTNLLILETSANDTSLSALLAQEFADKVMHHDLIKTITRRNLATTPLNNLDQAATQALRAGADEPTHAQQEAMTMSDTLIAELEEADMVVIAAPMHNFTISAQMRTWLDYVTRPGKSFGYGENGPQGLLSDKDVYVISTRGGQYGDGAADAPHPYDFQSGYLRHILGFIGLRSVQVIAANGMDMGDEARKKGLADARAKTDELIKQHLAKHAA